MPLAMSAVWAPPPVAPGQSLESIDLRGDCNYVGGAPSTAGATQLRDEGRTVELVAHGTEFGHHCGEDQGRFAFTTLEGNFDVTVQVVRVSNHGATQFYGDHGTVAKAGIMARENNAPSARYVAIWAVSNDAEHAVDAYHFDLRKVPGAWLGNQPKDSKSHAGDEACTFVYGYINRQVSPAELF